MLSATSVLVQYVKEDIVYAGSDPGGYPRRYHHLVGQGRATLYVDGRAIPVHWSRPTARDHTEYTYLRWWRAGRPAAGRGVVGDPAYLHDRPRALSAAGAAD